MGATGYDQSTSGISLRSITLPSGKQLDGVKEHHLVDGSEIRVVIHQIVESGIRQWRVLVESLDGQRSESALADLTTSFTRLRRQAMELLQSIFNLERSQIEFRNVQSSLDLIEAHEHNSAMI